MARRALIIGIDTYDYGFAPLKGCADDALEITEMLQFHGNYAQNYTCEWYISGGRERLSLTFVRDQLLRLFTINRDDEVVFYFSGHGFQTGQGTYLVTQDGTEAIPGLLLNELLNMANASPARDVLIVLDCFDTPPAKARGILPGRSAVALAGGLRASDSRWHEQHAGCPPVYA